MNLNMKYTTFRGMRRISAAVIAMILFLRRRLLEPQRGQRERRTAQTGA